MNDPRYRVILKDGREFEDLTTEETLYWMSYEDGTAWSDVIPMGHKEVREAEPVQRFQATASFNEEDGYCFGVCGKDNVLFTVEGLTEAEVIYFRDLLDVILPDDKCLNYLTAADDPSPPA
jgi:hypothetical protein